MCHRCNMLIGWISAGARENSLQLCSCHHQSLQATCSCIMPMKLEDQAVLWCGLGILCGPMCYWTTHSSNDPWGTRITTVTFLEEPLVSTRVISKYLLFICSVCIVLLLTMMLLHATFWAAMMVSSCWSHTEQKSQQTTQQQTVKNEHNHATVKTQSNPLKSTC